MKRVTIVVKDGVVAEVYAPDSIEVEVLDYDTPTCELVQPLDSQCPRKRYDLYTQLVKQLEE